MAVTSLRVLIIVRLYGQVRKHVHLAERKGAYDSPMKNEKMRYIVRFDYDAGKGTFWLVRFQEGSERAGTRSVVAQRTFMDNAYGGKRKSLQAAKDWRDEMAVKLNKLEDPHSLFKRYSTKAKSNTGVVGVCYIEGIGSDGRYRNQYRVEWREADEYGKRRPRAKIFSVGTGDKDKAFRQAVRWRKQMEKLHYTGPKK